MANNMDLLRAISYKLAAEKEALLIEVDYLINNNNHYVPSGTNDETLTDTGVSLFKRLNETNSTLSLVNEIINENISKQVSQQPSIETKKQKKNKTLIK